MFHDSESMFHAKFLCERYAQGHCHATPFNNPNFKNFNPKIGNFELVFELEKFELKKYLFLKCQKIFKKLVEYKPTEFLKSCKNTCDI